MTIPMVPPRDIEGPNLLKGINLEGLRVYRTAVISVSEDAIVGAGTVVVKDVEPWTVVAGFPARSLGSKEADSNARTNASRWATL